MEEYLYLNTKDDDFILLGNEDAFSGKREQTDAIIKVLKEYYDKGRILTILRNYLIGYEIGIIEKKTVNGLRSVATFDYKTGELKITDGEEISTLPYEEEYRKIQTDSLEKAYTLTKNL